MKSFRTVILGVALLLAGGTAGCDKQQEPQTVTFEVDGMVCESCSEAITAKVAGLEGVSACTVDHEAGTAVVTFTPGEGAMDPDRGEALATIEDEIESLGYEATAPSS